MRNCISSRCGRADRVPAAAGGASSLSAGQGLFAGQARHRKHEAAQCQASATDAISYEWEQPDIPRLTDAGELVEESRIKAHEVGANQRSSIITVSNLLQVHPVSHLADCFRMMLC